MTDSSELHWLARRRAELNLKQEDVARRLHEMGIKLNRVAISHWETGKTNPPLHDSKFRIALAQILQLSVQEVLASSGYEIERPFSQDTLDIAEMIDDLSTAQKQVIHDIVAMLTSSEKSDLIDVKLQVTVGTKGVLFTMPIGSGKSTASFSHLSSLSPEDSDTHK